MRHRPANALLAALACAVGLALTGAVALILPIAQAHDSATLHGFTLLSGHSRLSRLATDLAHTVDPSEYAVLALLLAAVAFLRGRPRVALAVPLTMLAASATTEILKPLIGHPRYSEWLSGGGTLLAASWPSGHATAAMMVALCGVLVAPRLLRPVVALLGTGLAVGVSYSILLLGWHFPSDVLGGFLVAGCWVALALAALWQAEARWPQAGPRSALQRVSLGHGRSDLLVPAALLAATFGAAIGVVILRGRLVEAYGAAHLSFVAGALAIAGLAAMLATGMTVALRR
ncbi:MAG TPA: phosphatase PAP2 family protein [Solirubrobacteraceae bacterium]|nr:phosphatase PAP2 family protein [Solirubrobacteraceae bacterium]